MAAPVTSPSPSTAPARLGSGPAAQAVLAVNVTVTWMIPGLARSRKGYAHSDCDSLVRAHAPRLSLLRLSPVGPPAGLRGCASPPACGGA